LSLEHDGHCFGHSDYFSIHKAELLVFVKESVHVFNPDGVNRTVENDPSSCGRFVLGIDTFAEDCSNNTIGKLLRYGVILAVELVMQDRLWVYHVTLDFHLA
jgi:hypothetical protein